MGFCSIESSRVYRTLAAARQLFHIRKFVLLFGAGFPFYCNAQDIVWLKHDTPPATITEGPYEDRGYIDEVIAATLRNLPQFHVTLSKVPLGRELELMKAGGPYCARDLLKTTGREK